MADGQCTIRCRGQKRKRGGYYTIRNGQHVFVELQTDDESDGTQAQHDIPTAQGSVTDSDTGLTSGSGSNSHTTIRVEAIFESPNEDEARSAYIERRRKVSEQWSTLRQQMGNQLVKNAYPATFTCSLCKNKWESIYRCQDCGPTAYFCKECFDKHHGIVFLHVSENWDTELHCFKQCNNFITWTRPDKHTCISTTTTSVIIIDDKGRQHYQGLQICHCEPISVILLKYGLWPASPSVPRVAFTIDFMLTLKAIFLEGQVSLHAFCKALQMCRPGLNRHKDSDMIPDIYRIISWETVLNFMWVDHYVSYLQFMDGFPDGTTCNACPKESDDDKRRMAMDGNMNLVRRAKAGHSVRDPMHQGRFFLQQSSVDEYVREDKDIKSPEDQNCSRFQASSVIRAKNKTAKLEFTGVFASVCSHDFPCAIFNMRYGERMGYPIFMMDNLQHVKVLLYDLGCQLETVLKKRNIDCPSTLGVSIFHIFGHKMACQLQYNPRSMLDAGLFDGEGTERLWSYLGRFNRISKEMTPENRQDVLTEALLYYGHRLAIKMGDTLGERLGRAYVVQERTKKTLSDELVSLNDVSVNDVQDWSIEEKANAAIPQNFKEESWESTYAMRLHEYYTHCDEAEEDIPDEETPRLEAVLKRIERKHTIRKRWTRESTRFKDHLKEACREERLVKLRQVRTAVEQYDFMIYMQSKYSEGQSISHRVTRQLLEASKKVNQALGAYNKVPDVGDNNPPHKLQRADVTSVQAPVWQHLAGVIPGPHTIPSSTKRKLIDALNLNMRANEEIGLTSRDLTRHLQYLIELGDRSETTISELKTRISELESMDINAEFERGSLSILVSSKYRTYARENAVYRIHEKIQSNVNIQEYFNALHSSEERTADEIEVLDVVSAIELENEPHSLYESED